ncbi:tRNA glutamyl-Q(34) synthetase GluQRS [Zwartia sp.]|uniref:tRNA glutamyl-Q(34) synthetase GluQRS n=1 Tax=Zwartia sp. TaxID=2978004 RepID=UPI003BAE6EDC
MVTVCCTEQPSAHFPYVGRFAPSPSGPLHAGSVVAALASYLDARAHGGSWLVRMEDLDAPRNVHGADEVILQQLQTLGMRWDGEVLYQSRRLDAYQQSYNALLSLNLTYPCGCTRREIADSVLRMQGHFPEGERPYPGTCRSGRPEGRQAHSWRLRVPEGRTSFKDRWMGAMAQEVGQVVGDFVLRRADGIWAYQLAVVVDDAHQGVTHVVRGEDLLSSTARQLVLFNLLGLSPPTYLHVPVVTDEAGQKLSKQNGAAAIDLSDALGVLQRAWLALGFDPLPVADVSQFWAAAIPVWVQGLSRANLHGINRRIYDPR